MKSKNLIRILLVVFFFAHQVTIVMAVQNPKNRVQNVHEQFNSSIFGENAYIFNPAMNMKDIQTLLDTIYNRQSTRKSEFNKNRYALFFQPGTYNLDVKVGYYMQVYGLANRLMM